MTHSSPDGDTRRTALVLGGGGSAGNAWLIGVIAGLYESGVDLTGADLTVGTSAGATAAAQITGADPGGLFADVLASEALLASRPSPGRRPGSPTLTADHLARFDAIIAGAADHADMRRTMGRALEADSASPDSASPGSAHERWRATVASRLPRQDWPQQRLILTAVDTSTGGPVLLDRDSEVDLVDAVAASCAGGFAYAVGDRRLMDGGYRTNADNADLAEGYARVLVLSPLSGQTRIPASWGMHLADHVARLRADGSEVLTVFPDDAARTAFGDNLMNPASRPPAARAGYAQGQALADEVGVFWRPA